MKNKKIKLITDEAEKRLEKAEHKYVLTPKGILWIVFANVYGIKNPNNNTKELEKFSLFNEKLLKALSEYSTNGKESDFLGKDFNDLYFALVRSMNLAGKYRQILIENGFDLDEIDESLDK